MVAYSYKGRFVAPIRVGLGLPVQDEHRELGDYQPGQIIKPKTQTIRADGKRRHARPGETIQNYYGMRQPKCFKIGDARCTAADPILVYVEADHIEVKGRSHLRTLAELDAFAQSDGFADWSQMKAFWLEEHDGKHLGPFVGVLIRWEVLS